MTATNLYHFQVWNRKQGRHDVLAYLADTRSAAIKMIRGLHPECDLLYCEVSSTAAN